VAEGARLESVYTGNRIVGSNPTPSASLLPKAVLRASRAADEPPIFRSVCLKVLYSDRKLTDQIALSRPGFLLSSVLLSEGTVFG
jgi:hypothetical protein